MKKTLLIICIFLSFSLVQLSAQSDSLVKVINKTDVFTYDNSVYSFPVYCNGEIVDILWGNIKVKGLYHVEKGLFKWAMYIWDGELEGLYGEVFQIHWSVKVFLPKLGDITYRFNLVGNMGSHYINSGTSDPNTGILTIDKTVCPGN